MLYITETQPVGKRHYYDRWHLVIYLMIFVCDLLIFTPQNVQK